ncbi:MAG: sodium:proton antiporter [Dysgonamonadaceae bacterium]|jgi:Na+/H+ antiporter NhaD/arsenite permease-like protein|nr:sodium:proton antiporter [Dysgonamonadaceae bacterium]
MHNIETVPVWILIPFVVQLLVIALAPLFAERRWENNRNKLFVSLALSVPIVIFMFLNGIIEKLTHQMLFDYLPFIILLEALFVVTGGIHLRGDIKARPGVNTLFLATGYVLASIMGTTGAAMLLIRPVLKTNDQRKFKVHTVLFFIAAVANCGGLLTPLGDPPLFLLYLRGANFTWFLNLLPAWLLTGVILLGVYYAVERYFFRKEAWQNISADMREQVPLRISGNVNFIFLLGIVLSVAFINSTYIPSMGGEHAPVWIKFLREIALLSMAAASLIFTKKKVRRSNKFTWTPILEVAAVFLGIFATMTPALIFLNQNAASMGLHAPWQFYYATGALSSFLDNAPTALAFYSVAQGLPAVPPLAAGIPEILLKAVSVGSVFFGAMTYIGNGPNFMVKAIAEENGVKMPGFFAYMLKFSLIVLLPVYILVQLIFFP